MGHYGVGLPRQSAQAKHIHPGVPIHALIHKPAARCDAVTFSLP